MQLQIINSTGKHRFNYDFSPKDTELRDENHTLLYCYPDKSNAIEALKILTFIAESEAAGICFRKNKEAK